MKKIFLFIISLSLFFACQNDKDDIFTGDFSDLNISFEAIPGGAIMHYTLPDNNNIQGIEIVYSTETGRKVARGTYMEKELKIEGFVVGAEKVHAQIFVIDTDENRSAPINKTFSTKSHAGYQLFENDRIKVGSYWNGFNVDYDVPAGAEGFLNVARVRPHPSGEGLDTMLIETLPLTEGVHNYTHGGITEEETTTVIVWTEDKAGNLIKSLGFEDIAIAKTQMVDMNPDWFTGSSKELPDKKVGKQYLFDGDKKGFQCYYDNHDGAYAFFSEEYAVPGDWYIELPEARVLAYIKLFEPISCNNYWIAWNNQLYFDSFKANWPCDIQIYASTDNQTWVQISNYYHHPDPTVAPDNFRWTYNSTIYPPYYYREQAVEAPYSSVQLNFAYDETKYKYIKIHVEDTYLFAWNGQLLNGYDRLMLQELELYIKKQ